ncbi:MAG: hypothetical protein LBK45_05100 [Tannerellaceae bacterium]|nr:hypothetical protein [Tannerellaceae bacterium]
MIQNIFDYRTSARAMNIPDSVLLDIEKDIRNEYPDDAMLAELHILRALNNYKNYMPVEIISPPEL